MKIFRMLYIALLSVSLIGCSDTIPTENSISDGIPNQSMNSARQKENSLCETIVECADGYNAAVRKQITFATSESNCDSYTISLEQGKDGIQSTIKMDMSKLGSYTISVFDSENSLLQTITGSGPREDILDFLDINRDGYADMQLSNGGTLNTSYDLYLWSSNLGKFKKVVCCEEIFYYEIGDGYIENWGKLSSNSVCYQYLVWEGDDTLVLKSEVMETLEDDAS